MPKCHYQLVKGRIDTRAADLIDMRFWIEGDGDAFVQLFFSLSNELDNVSIYVKIYRAKVAYRGE